jgi:mannosyltransferase
MASGREAQVTDGAAAPGPAPGSGDTGPERARLTLTRLRVPGPGLARLLPDWTLLLPAAAAMAVMLWGIATPSFWRDEAASLSAADRSVPQLLRMLGHIDAVHGFYYLLLWPVVHYVGTTEMITRLPSAIAMAAAALGVAVIGRRLRSRRTGLYAGLVFAALPLVGVQAHDARPYAFETAAAVLSSYLLLRAADKPTRLRFAWYGLSLLVLGYLHLFGLLIILAHAFVLIPAARLAQARRGAASASQSWAPPAGTDETAADATGAYPAGPTGLGTGRLLRRWLITCVIVGALTVPMLWLGWQQRWAVSWLPKPDLRTVTVLARSLAAGTALSAVIFAVFMGLGIVRADWPDRILRPLRRPPGGGNGGTAAAVPARPLTAWAGRPERALSLLAVPWLLLPPGVLLIASEFKPVYELIYLEYCLPAVALLVGAGLSAIGWPLRLAALSLVVILGLPMQYNIRLPLSNGYIGSAAAFVGLHEKPGDAIYYPDQAGVPNWWNNVYPDEFNGLREIGLAQTMAQANRLVGTSAPLPVLEQQLRSVNRLWMVEMRGEWLDPPFSLRPDFRLALSWRRNQMWARLYVRVPPGSRHHHHHRPH